MYFVRIKNTYIHTIRLVALPPYKLTCSHSCQLSVCLYPPLVVVVVVLVVVVVVVVVVVFISTVQHQLVSTAINVYNTDIMES